MLQMYFPWGVEKHIDNGSLRRSKEHLVDERLALVPTAVATRRAWRGPLEERS